MTLRLSIPRIGFAIDRGQLRADIDQLTQAAASITVALIDLGRAQSRSADDLTATSLRSHRDWLRDQARLLQDRLTLIEAAAHKRSDAEPQTSFGPPRVVQLREGSW